MLEGMRQRFFAALRMTGPCIDDGHILVVDEFHGVPGDYRLDAEPFQVFHQPLS